MANYEIVLNVTGNSVAEMNKIEAALKKAGVTADKEMKRIGEAVESADRTFQKLQGRIAEVFAAREIFEFGKHVLEVTAEFEGFENRIKFASMNTIDATENMAFLRREVEQLHLPMRQVFEGFSEMQAGLKGTGIEGTHLRTLFEGISTAAATLHLPQYQLQRTLYDLKEIGEIGINMRIARSLSTALPGIGGIVKQAFGGKSLHDLEKEHMSGPEFLEKLGPALKRNFEGGLASYADSLQARMNDVSNKFISSQVDLGEKLKPVYIGIMDGLTGVISKGSQFVGFLYQNSDSVRKVWEVTELLIGSYVVYKGVLLGTSAMEAIHTATLNAMTVAEYTAEYGAEGLAYSMGELGLSISTLGLGALALGIAAIVKQFIDWDTHLDDVVEKLSKLKELGSTFEREQQHYNDLSESYAAFVKDPSKFTAKEKESLASGLNEYAQRQHAQLNQHVLPHLQATSDSLYTVPRFTEQTVTSGSIGGGGGGTFQVETPAWRRISAASDSLHTIATVTQKNIDAAEAALKNPDLAKALKRSATFNPVGDTAEHSTHLAGAEGGLGQAKVINIKIDRVMTVENHDNKNLVGHAEVAADYIIRTANNFAESQSGTY